MLIELTETQAQFLRCVLSEDLDKNEDHLSWLQSPAAATEEDKDLQTAECETSMAQCRALLALLGEAPAPAEPA